MLIEAHDQVPRGSWTAWLKKNFDLSDRTARVYMQWAREQDQIGSGSANLKTFNSLSDMRGDTERRREAYQSKQQQAFRKVLREVARDDFVQERQARDEEVRLHRELAEELIDLGYRALATRLHPDRGGSKDASKPAARWFRGCSASELSAARGASVHLPLCFAPVGLC
jgi:hypothetical protein